MQFCYIKNRHCYKFYNIHSHVYWMISFFLWWPVYSLCKFFEMYINFSSKSHQNVCQHILISPYVLPFSFVYSSIMLLCISCGWKWVHLCEKASFLHDISFKLNATDLYYVHVASLCIGHIMYAGTATSACVPTSPAKNDFFLIKCQHCSIAPWIFFRAKYETYQWEDTDIVQHCVSCAETACIRISHTNWCLYDIKLSLFIILCLKHLIHENV